MDTICAIATAAGQGAVGMVRVSGDGARDMLERVTGRQGFAARRMALADIRDPASGQRLDRAMVCWMPGPRSYTGQDVVEVFGHGGALNMEALLGVFVGLGARQAEPGEFTRRAFVNGRMDLTQAEAVAELIAARSDRALGNARALLAGELGRRVRRLRQRTIELAADLEACLDFAEDIERPVSDTDLQATHHTLVAQIERLARSYDRGRRLNGVDVALVGPVNGGKSSLFNALLGSRRALVSEQEGTTRDYIEAELVWDGLSVTLVDTAGQRPAPDMSGLEREGHQMGHERTGRCDVVVRVVDISQPDVWVQAGRQPERHGEGGHGVIVAANKTDLIAEQQRQQRSAALRSELGVPVVGTCALSGEGLDQLRAEVLRHVLGDESGDGQLETVQVTQKRQHDALVRAARALRQGLSALDAQAAAELVVEHTREALGALGQITGETYTEDVLDVVFARFCVGK